MESPAQAEMYGSGIRLPNLGLLGKVETTLEAMRAGGGRPSWKKDLAWQVGFHSLCMHRYVRVYVRMYLCKSCMYVCMHACVLVYVCMDVCLYTCMRLSVYN